MAVNLSDDVTWINECYQVEDGKHEHVSVYLIDTGSEYILIDSGSFYHEAGIKGQIEDAIGGSKIDALILSHTDLPHSGNIHSFSEEWNDIDLLVGTGSPTQGLPESAVPVSIGQSSIFGRDFSFIDPPLADRNHTKWVYDHGSGVLFTVDGFGAYHRPDECNKTSTSIAGDISRNDIYEYHRDALVWLEFVDVEKLRRKIDEIFSKYDITYIAPVHGPPISKSDLDEYIERFYESVGKISSGGRNFADTSSVEP